MEMNIKLNIADILGDGPTVLSHELWQLMEHLANGIEFQNVEELSEFLFNDLNMELLISMDNVVLEINGDERSPIQIMLSVSTCGHPGLMANYTGDDQIFDDVLIFENKYDTFTALCAWEDGVPFVDTKETIEWKRIGDEWHMVDDSIQHQ